MRVNYLGTVHTVQVGAALRGLGLLVAAVWCPVVQCEHPAVLQIHCGCAASAQLLAPPSLSAAHRLRCPACWSGGRGASCWWRPPWPSWALRVRQAWAVHSNRLLDCCTNVVCLLYSTNVARHGLRWAHCTAVLFCGHRRRRQSTHSSAASPLLLPGYSSYAPSKWAVRGLADCLHNELQGTGVHVSVAYPPDTGEHYADGRGACGD